ncbi:MAG: nuclear transport factor 2 family protein, partial [Plesiomonas sp.]
MLAQHQAMIDQFSEAYAELTAEKITHFPDLYAPDVVFIDPVQQIYGVQDLQAYFFRITEQTHFHRVNVIRAFSSGNDFFILWEMTYAHANLEQGADIFVEG